MSSKNRWLISLAAVAFVVTVSAVIICNNRVFPSGSSGRPGVVAVNDSSAGVIIAWHENNTIYAQHIDGSGKTQWGETGLFITECPGSGLTLLSDGSGGAIVSWYDESFRPDDRDDPGYYGPAPFYCRRITPDGWLIWNDEPVSEGRERYIVPDGSGGAIIAWDNYTVKYRGLWDNSLRIQKIAPDGSMPWGDEGILVVASSPFRTVTDEDKTAGIKGTYTRSFPTYSGYHLIAGDDEGGIYVAWAEENLTSKGSIYLQRISSNGTFSWDDRVHVADKNLNSLSTDGQGGVIITGIDPDNSIVPVNNRKIRIDREGNIVESGIFDPADIGISDGTGGSFSIRVEEDPPYGDPRERRYIP